MRGISVISCYIIVCKTKDSLTCLFLGTPALTSRGFVEEDFAKVAYFFDLAVKLALKIKGEAQGILSYLSIYIPLQNKLYCVWYALKLAQNKLYCVCV